MAPEGEATQKEGKSDGVVKYRFSRMKQERLNKKISRKMVVGKNEMLGYVTLKKRGYVPPHKHLSEQITIMLKGALKFTINGRNILVKAGEVLVIPPNVEHEAVALEGTIEIDCFSPLREDWLSGKDQYLRQEVSK